MTEETENAEVFPEGTAELLAGVVAGLDNAIADLTQVLEREEITVLVPAGRGFTLTVHDKYIPLHQVIDELGDDGF